MCISAQDAQAFEEEATMAVASCFFDYYTYFFYPTCSSVFSFCLQKNITKILTNKYMCAKIIL